MSKTKSPYQIYSKPSWLKRNWVALVTLVIGFLAINLIFISKSYWGVTVDPTKAGVLGDFVGGYIGTIFSLVAVMFLYLTLKDQRESSTIEKFESKYFELIKLHRDNVSELVLGLDSGKKIFVMLIRELRELFKIAKDVSEINNYNYSREQLFVAAYCGLFFGVGPNSTRMLRDALFEFDSEFTDKFIYELEKPTKKTDVKAARNFNYTPFEGHQSRLGHYYRHLFQTVKYVDKQEINIDKYGYIKTLRAQLSTHEQALLFINCLSTHGRIWNTETLLLRYKFIKNIPPKFFDKEKEIDVASYFPNDYFEFQE